MSRKALVDGRPLVFVSYSREDEQWRRRFTEMLKPLVRERRLDVWSDERIVTGYGWRPQLAEAIGRSQLALLLVSPSFLASDFIMEQELPALVERGVPLVPVLVRPCLWQEVPVLEGLQWAHDPALYGPVASSPDPEGQVVRACLTLSMMPAVRDMAPSPAGRVPVPPAPGRVRPPAPGVQAGDLHNIPLPPRAFVAREELAGLREAVLGAADSVVGVTGTALGLHGQGGIGKTVLAAALARDDMVRRHFPDGVFWVTLGEQDDLVAAQIALLDQLGAPHPGLRSAAEGLAALGQALADRRCLLIVDDVWSATAAAAFRVVGSASRILYTTRDAAVLDGVSAEVVPLGVLPPGVARELLRGLTGVTALPAEADRICVATGGVALAVALVGAAIGAGGQSWAQAATQLEAGGGTFLNHPYANTFKAMQVGVAALDEADARAYRSLAVYPEDAMVPAVAAGRLWAYLLGDSAADTAARLGRLASRSLLTVHGDGISFHDLQREFLLLHTEDLRLAHRDLLAAYRARLLPGAARWSRLPSAEPYIWENLIYHLCGAGDGSAIQAVACDLAWIARRCFRGGPYAAESDLRQAAALYPEHKGIGWLLRLLTQWGHLLTRLPTIGDLAAILASRVGDAPAPIDAGTLADLLPQFYLAPRWGMPHARPGLGRVLEGHSGLVAWMAFSPDGQQLTSGDFDGVVHRWDAVTGRRTVTVRADFARPAAMAFSPDGVTLATVTHDQRGWLWDMAVGRLIAPFGDGSGWPNGLAFSADGRTLATGSNNGMVQLWDPATGRRIGILEGRNRPVACVTFSADGLMLASGDNEGQVQLWNLVTSRRIATFRGHYRMVTSLAFSPDGQMLASGGDDSTVRLRDLTSGLFAVPVKDSLARVLKEWPSLVPKDWRPEPLRGHYGGVASVAFSPDGQMLASGGDDGTVRLWDPVVGHCIVTLKGHYGGVASVAFSPGGQVLASGGEDGSVRLWDPIAGRVAVRVEGDPIPASSVASSPDGRVLASGGEDGGVRLWDPVAGRCFSTQYGHSRSVARVAFSPDSQILASGGVDGGVRLWDPATGQLIATPRRRSPWFAWNPRRVSGVAFSPDGSLLASGSDRAVRLSHLTPSRLATALKGLPGWFVAVAFSPDGRMLASGGADGSIRWWDLAAGRLAAAWKGHSGGVVSMVFSSDGRTLASGGGDGGLCLWDLAAGRLAAAWKGHSGGVVSVAFSPDGRMLASSGQDRTVHVWVPGSSARLAQLRVGTPVTALSWGPGGIAVAGSEGLMLLAVIDRASSMTSAPEPGLRPGNRRR